MKPDEFFKRWGEGIQKITPFQQIKVSVIGSVLVLIGIIIGVVTMIISKTWWLLVILCGSLFVSGVSFIGTIQRYKALKKIDDMIKEATVI
jgi:ABC-type multidrug transport system permease subunit